eukprot:gb/GFBE01065857.1/.p1 GENE.gb/GFBE01065857.1/~~gb/GFBE01065857.1/.p1  ORF type:complete len:809 (+),score=265.44 gb/GFBE01065857.1/:1-2427(+)
MGLLRSEFMKYGTLVLPVQEAKRIVGKIGKETNMQFEDDNARDMRRPYRKHIQRIDEMERIIRFLVQEIGSIEGCEITKNKVDEFLAADELYSLDAVEGDLQSLYQNFLKFKENNSSLVNERNQAVEEAQVLAMAKSMLGAASASSAAEESFESSSKKPLVAGDELGARLGHLAGVVAKVDETRFARTVWRASRGNTFVSFSPIEKPVKDPKTGLEVEKSVFVIYFQGQAGQMYQKVSKVCAAFGVNMYGWPADATTAGARYAHLQKLVQEKEAALEGYQYFMRTEAKDLLAPSSQNPQGNSKIEEWRLFCIKEKSIYNIMNLCSGDMALRVNVWYPASDEKSIFELLQKLNAGSQQGAFLALDRSSGAAKSTPPTYIRTNEYTEGWQDVIDTYGIPKYQEANPGLLTVVTFPFIFGMMYGDVGHGTLLFLAGCYLCQNAESFRMTQPALFTARYMVLSLGIFAVFAGFMYNDFFSVGLQIFESRFKDMGNGQWEPTYDVKNTGGPGPYPFGLDWAWVGASNELLFVNSMKMKLSVLFGVLQMTVGIFLRWSNAFYEKNMTDFICECVPMLIFMICFFGWMDWMILYKWVHPIDNPPSIINSLICMAMGQEDKFPLWDGSVELAKTLMMWTVAAVPVMLLPKPFVLLYQHNQEQKKKGDHQLMQDEEVAVSGGHGHGHGEEFEFGEIFIHQIIETIEFVLGTVSHTASYLRIWALSLAHQQLSLVFFQKTITMGLEMPFPTNGIVIYFMFAAWFGITLAVLLGMDVLECFLHTLRLHWVEFQSKFYKAEGIKFAPYSIKKLIMPTGDE